MKKLGMIATVLAILAAAPTAFGDDCISGTTLQDLPAGPNGGTFGQQRFDYKEDLGSVTLITEAESDHQMYLFDPVTGMWVFGDDWCLDVKANAVQFLRSPLREYTLGGGAGAPVAHGAIIWIGYVPKLIGP